MDVEVFPYGTAIKTIGTAPYPNGNAVSAYSIIASLMGYVQSTMDDAAKVYGDTRKSTAETKIPPADASLAVGN
ncbi:hypothetical protein GCM10023231_11270 [Olivibacter ginsenosidimutans]|uniref:Uncharacterized protein n=1 Tax=Olivibacter ginsenosidimutans TaxID=1176537 RepID=A0ABP9ASR2_9SPHI